MVHAALLLLMLGARTTVTPFHHQPEAQHPKFLAIHKNAGRLPHLWVTCGRRLGKNFLTDCSIGRVRSRVRPVDAADVPLALMLCADRVPIDKAHSKMR